ncbi:MAG: ORF6N domain-containing protein [Ruminococcaceae bacterium]|nr:ORF6N domain-containing protein [Oscillospiraceae bacterium]
MELATVNNQTMAIKEYKGQRVLTFKDIDKAHCRVDGTAHRSFKANRKRFIEGVDYYRLKKDEIRPFGINSPNGAIVITESGYLMLAKSFTDDLAWTVQRELVNCYFRNKPQTAVPTKGEQLTLETSEYFYYDKSYNGKPVLSAADVEHFTGIKLHKIRQCLKTFCEKHIDYILLEGPWLAQYKAQNPNVSKLASAEFVVTKSGFVKLMKFCDCKTDTPKCFIEEKKPVIAAPSESMHRLMGYIQREIQQIDWISNLMLTTNTTEVLNNYRKDLINRIKGLRGYCSDIETIRIG